MQNAILSLEQFPRLQGETDDRGRFQRAINATPVGGTLWVPPGHYFADSIKIRKSMQLSFSMDAKMEAVEVNRDILIVEGKRETRWYQLLKPVRRGERKLLLSEEPVGWQVGDMIVLTDETVRFTDGQPDVNTEVHEIAFIDENQVILRDFVRLPKAVAKQKGNLYRVFPVDDVKIHNLTFQMKEGSTKGIGIFMQYVRNAVVDGFKGYRSAGSGIQVRKAIHTRVRNFCILQPQVTGSGQGYGVQFFGGCLDVVVQDGYTVGCRHAVDLDGSFDVYVSRVTDYHSVGAAFMMAHNGFTSDVVFEHCRTYHTLGSGFVACSQGFADPLLWTFYSFTLKHCTVILAHSAHAGVVMEAPCKEVTVLHCQFRYSSSQGIGLNNAGIRICPKETHIRIFACRIEGVRKAIDLQGKAASKVVEGQCRILLRDIDIEQCDTVIACANGTNQQFTMLNIHCERIGSTLFHFHPKGSFAKLVVEDLSVCASPHCTFCVGSFRGHRTKGSIRKIMSDRPGVLSLSQGWSLTYDHLFLNGNGESVLLVGPSTSSSRQPLPDGWVDGQTLMLITKDGNWTLYKGDNMIFKKQNQESICLDEKQRTVTFLWKDGFWYQMD